MARPRHRARRSLLVALPLAVTGVLLPVTTAHASGTTTGVSVTRDGRGHATITDLGYVTTYGTVPNFGGPAGAGFSGSIVDISVMADGSGYVAVSSRGQVYAYGNAQYKGAPSQSILPSDVSDISMTQDGRGYAMVTKTGHVYAFGTVAYQGGAPGFPGTSASIAVRPDGEGYVVVANTGHVYAYGVEYRGNFPSGIVDAAVISSGDGYLALAGSGQVHTKNVPYYGSPSNFAGGITGISVRNDGAGYIAVSGTNQRWAYGMTSYGGGPARGQQQNARADVTWTFVPPATVSHVDQQVRVLKKAASTYWSAAWTWGSTPLSTGGYMGLQIDGYRFDGTIGETAIFSLWNATGARHGVCGSFSGEGTGLSCRLRYLVTKDRVYRLRVARQEADGVGQWWGAWVRDTVTGNETYIGSLRVAASADTISRYMNFSEYFGPSVDATNLVPQSRAEFAQPQAMPLASGLYASTGQYTTHSQGAGSTSTVETNVPFGNGLSAVRITLGG